MLSSTELITDFLRQDWECLIDPQCLHVGFHLFRAVFTAGSELIHSLFIVSSRLLAFLQGWFGCCGVVYCSPDSSSAPSPLPSFSWISSHEWERTLWRVGVIRIHGKVVSKKMLISVQTSLYCSTLTWPFDDNTRIIINKSLPKVVKTSRYSSWICRLTRSKANVNHRIS